MMGSRGLAGALTLLACVVVQAVSWQAGEVLLSPERGAAFDETAVKDPSVVFFEGRWHVFYTARGRGEYTTGYVSAATLDELNTAPRHELKQIRGRGGRYACAPQVFFFAPQGLWYLIGQTRDANYQPIYSTTRTLDRPESWSSPRAPVAKDEDAKWIDFWIICDEDTAYLFYTRNHRDVVMRRTSLEAFPSGWSEGRVLFSGIHEAVHIYKMRGQDEYHMIYELNEKGVRSFGLSKANHLTGPWEKVTDAYATGSQLSWGPDDTCWTDMVSHGEMLRTGYDQKLEYDASAPAMLIQGRLDDAGDTPYPELPWSLGLIRRNTADGELTR